jgi:hypothetical protein
MIDLDCERVGPGLWGEPANLVTNLAFLAAAWAIWRDPARSPRASGVLAALAVCIALGSATFHATATPWARRLDEGPIVVFELAFVWLYARRIVGLSTWGVAAALVTLVVLMVLAREQPDVLNGSLAYVPPFVVACGLGVYHHRTQPRRRASIFAGAAIFGAAIAIRTVDLAVCAGMPLGTHFLWHVLVALALVLFVRGLVANLSK